MVNMPSKYTPTAVDVGVDRIILAGVNTVSEHLAKKYHGVMDVASDAMYYMRTYVITGMISPRDQTSKGE
jgi:hypothetical protein